VRVTFLVGEGVMLAVVSHPLDHRTFDRQRAEHRQGVPNGGIGLKRAVGEHPVKAHRDPQTRGHVAHGQDGHIDPLDEPAPKHDHR
jgi:hypothetical protein